MITSQWARVTSQYAPALDRSGLYALGLFGGFRLSRACARARRSRKAHAAICDAPASCVVHCVLTLSVLAIRELRVDSRSQHLGVGGHRAAVLGVLARYVQPLIHEHSAAVHRLLVVTPV